MECRVRWGEACQPLLLKGFAIAECSPPYRRLSNEKAPKTDPLLANIVEDVFLGDLLPEDKVQLRQSGHLPVGKSHLEEHSD